MDAFEELITQLTEMVITIFLTLKEMIFPSPTRPEHYRPIDYPEYRDNSLILTFPCQQFQVQRTSNVRKFWEQTDYVHKGENFVFVRAEFGESIFSKLTIQFRPRHATMPVVYNFYNSEVNFNTQINNVHVEQIEKLEQYIVAHTGLDQTEKDEYINTVEEMKNGQKPPKLSLNKLWKFIMKHQDEIGTVSDVISIIGTILGMFE